MRRYHLIKLRVMAIILLFMFFGIRIEAKAEKSGDYEYEIMDDGTAEITKYIGTDTVLQIPETINGYVVTSVGYLAFSGCSSLTDITIPENVTNIEGWAFEDCSSLTSIKVSPENKMYDSRENCNAIIETENSVLILGCKNTIIPDGVTSIADYAFDGCCELEAIKIPNSVTSIGRSAFWGCEKLKSVELSDNLTSIGSCAFEWCSSIETITIPDGVTRIEDEVFSSCKSLENVEIPNSVKYIGYEAFYGCNLLELTIPNGVEYIGDCAFEHCMLGNLVIPDSVTYLGYAVFRWSNVTTVKVSKNLTEIPVEVFGGCMFLSYIEIPENISRINNYAFSLCENLTYIKIPEGVTYIGEGAFNKCKQLSLIELPATITKIGENAFEGCSEKLIVTVEPDSYAEKYVINAGYAYRKSAELSNEQKEKDLKTATIASIPAQTYSNEIITPKPTITYSGVTLIENKDYTLTYPADCKNVGKKEITVQGIGDYVGTQQITYEIVPLDVSVREPIWFKSSRGNYQKVYTGKEILLDESVYVVQITSIKYTCTKDDYEVAGYSDNTNVGDASLKLQFKGNLTGTRTYQFEIIPPAPKLKSVKKKGKGLALTWNKVSCADGYYIYRSTKKGTGYKKLATVKKNKTVKYTDKKAKKGKKYYYKIVAYKNVSKKIYLSSDSAVKQGKR